MPGSASDTAPSLAAGPCRGLARDQQEQSAGARTLRRAKQLLGASDVDLAISLQRARLDQTGQVDDASAPATADSETPCPQAAGDDLDREPLEHPPPRPFRIPGENRTVQPSARSARATWPPTKPVAPVRNAIGMARPEFY